MIERDNDNNLAVSQVVILTSMVIVAFVWALPSVIGRYLVGLNDEVSAISLSFYRAFYGALGLIIWVYLLERKEKVKLYPPQNGMLTIRTSNIERAKACSERIMQALVISSYLNCG